MKYYIANNMKNKEDPPSWRTILHLNEGEQLAKLRGSMIWSGISQFTSKSVESGNYEAFVLVDYWQLQ